MSNYIYVSNDELYHHKYIKKVMVNGKWRYYYKHVDPDKFAKAEELERLRKEQRKLRGVMDRRTSNHPGKSRISNDKAQRDIYLSEKINKLQKDLSKPGKIKKAIDKGKKAIQKLFG